jgi:hypothetical protein
MSLKPINKKIIHKEDSSESDIELTMDDNITIVAFPSCLWELIKDASEKLGITTNEVLENSIREYCERNNI